METHKHHAWQGTGTAPRRHTHRLAVAVAVALAAASDLHAGVIETGNPELKLRWDNTVKYSAAFRLKDPSAGLIDGADAANLDDGDRNFDKGLISSRVDLLSEFDLTYRNLGARVSAAGWYDSVYHRATDNNSPATYNGLSVDHTRFTEGTRSLHGGTGELLDAFVFAKFNLGDMPGAVRAGRHALVYGETLFFGSNGIANAQQPIDVVKALSVPNTQFKELTRPVGQVSGQLQLRTNLSVGGYYQYKWEPTVLPGSGSYFQTVDFLGDGAESFLLGPARSVRQPDVEAKNSGQGGLQLKWTPEGSDIDLGFYAARYHDKTPQGVLYAIPTPNGPFPSTYRLAYHEGIRTYGISVTKTFGEFNVAAEASVRHNTPLSNPGTVDLSAVLGLPASDNRGNTTYPVGRTAHFNLSTMAALPSNALASETSLVAELAWNRVTSITAHADHLDPAAQRDAWSLRAVLTPSYRQVMPGLDIDVPIGIGYTNGRSGALGPAFGPDNGGDLSVGLSGRYLDVWNISLNYTHYYGKEAPGSRMTGSVTQFTYAQTFKDRDFLAFSLRRTF
jgi:hypothetical protein